MKTLAFALISSITLFLGACGSVENAIDCHGICTRYQSCFDKNYNVDSCESRCRGNANADKDFMSKTDACSNCLGNKDCASATFNCPSCVGIVP